MNGWNTQHQEFTLAKGDPNKINELISEFKLEGIVSFDKVNSLITTTLIHHRFIRLSDLLTLNISKVIAFTLPQYLQVIRQLFELLQGMKQLQIQHGDLRMENILLDLTSSSDKLDNKPIEVMFQIKLINFAQFYNVKMEDDFERGYQIYRQITECFPQQKNELDNENLYEFKKEAIFLDHLQDQINFNIYFGKIEQKEYSWDSKYAPTIIQNYYKQLPIHNHQKQIYNQIQQLHQYHLIVNHYAKLIQFNLFNNFQYSSEPKDFIKSCQIFDSYKAISAVEEKNIQQLVGQKSFNRAMVIYQTYIESEQLIYLKQKGYLQNINSFSDIIHNIEAIIQFRKEFFSKIIQDQKNQTNNNKLLKEIIKTYQKSQQIFNNMVISEDNHFKSNNLIHQYTEYVHYSIYFTQHLIEQLYKFKEMGSKYSEPIIEHCIDQSLGKQLKQKDLPDTQSFNNLMVDSWLKWIDQYIFNQQYINLSQLSLINKQQFKQFIKYMPIFA